MRLLSLLLIIIGTHSAFARFEIGPSVRFIDPDLLTSAIKLDQSTGTFSEMKSEETIEQLYDLRLTIWLVNRPSFDIGLYGDYQLPQSVNQVGIIATNSNYFTKTSTLKAYSGGLAFRIGGTTNDFNVGLEGSAGLGKATLIQGVQRFTLPTDSQPLETSRLEASATILDSALALTFARKVSDGRFFRLKLGYLYEISSIVQVDSASGPHYYGFAQDEDIYLADLNGSGENEEFRIKCSGPFAALSFEF